MINLLKWVTAIGLSVLLVGGGIYMLLLVQHLSERYAGANYVGLVILLLAGGWAVWRAARSIRRDLLK